MAELELSATMGRRARPREREAVKVTLRDAALLIGGSLVVDYAQIRKATDNRRVELVVEWVKMRRTPSRYLRPSGPGLGRSNDLVKKRKNTDPKPG